MLNSVQLMLQRKPRGLGLLDGGDGAVVGAGLADRLVVVLLVAVEMHRPDEIRARLVVLHPLFHQQRVGAQIDELPPRDDALDDRRQFLVQQRLAAGDRDDRGAALIDRLQRVGDGNALIQDLVGIVDLAAAGAGQIAAKQRLQHQHQRIALSPGQLLADQIAADVKLLKKRNAQCYRLFSTFRVAKSRLFKPINRIWILVDLEALGSNGLRPLGSEGDRCRRTLRPYLAFCRGRAMPQAPFAM